MIKILFLCHGNICRSPMAEFIMKDLVKKANLEQSFQIESAATSTEEIGNPVYLPARRKLSEHGIDCSGKRSPSTAEQRLREIRPSDWHGSGQPAEYVPDLRRRFCRQDAPADGLYRPPRRGSPIRGTPTISTRPGGMWRKAAGGCSKIISKEVQTSGQAGC